jgi:hypothetical protein
MIIDKLTYLNYKLLEALGVEPDKNLKGINIIHDEEGSVCFYCIDGEKVNASIFKNYIVKNRYEQHANEKK